MNNLYEVKCDPDQVIEERKTPRTTYRLHRFSFADENQSKLVYKHVKREINIVTEIMNSTISIMHKAHFYFNVETSQYQFTVLTKYNVFE